MSRTLIFVALLVLLFLVSPSSPATPVLARTNATFTVNNTNDATDATPGDGICETATGNGICTLRAAIQETNALTGTDTIIVPSGIYTLTIAGANEDNAATGDLDIKDDLTIQGAGADTTIIDGNQLDRVFDILGTANVDFEDITIRDGRENPIHFYSGGGIRIFSTGTITIANSLIFSNTATVEGGGIYNNSGRLTLENVTLTQNIAGNDGGGIFNLGSTILVSSTVSENRVLNNSSGGIFNGGIITLTDSVIAQNVVTTTSAGARFAGGFGNAGTAILNHVSVISNTASYEGGGILNTGLLTITQSIISGNISEYYFGGISNGDLLPTTATLSLSKSSIIGNHALTVGGISNAGIATLENISVFSNTAQTAYGGIGNGGTLTITASNVFSNSAEALAGVGNAGVITVVNSAIFGNTAIDEGGGFGNLPEGSASPAKATLINVTVSGNYVSNGYGGGILTGQYPNRPYPSTLTLLNTTLSNNSAITGSNLAILTSTVAAKNTLIANGLTSANCYGSLTSLGHNLEDANTCNLNASGDFTNTNPLLGPLQDNGGNTLTHALLPGSPAIDAGDNIGCPLTDQRGVLRPYGRACDIGAFELHYPFWMPLLFDNAP